MRALYSFCLIEVEGQSSLATAVAPLGLWPLGAYGSNLFVLPRLEPRTKISTPVVGGRARRGRCIVGHIAIQHCKQRLLNVPTSNRERRCALQAVARVLNTSLKMPATSFHTRRDRSFERIIGVAGKSQPTPRDRSRLDAQ
jgi:hypothetical protein